MSRGCVWPVWRGQGNEAPSDQLSGTIDSCRDSLRAEGYVVLPTDNLAAGRNENWQRGRMRRADVLLAFAPKGTVEVFRFRELVGRTVRGYRDKSVVLVCFDWLGYLAVVPCEWKRFRFVIWNQGAMWDIREAISDLRSNDVFLRWPRLKRHLQPHIPGKKFALA